MARAAPRATQAAHFSGEPAVTSTRAPWALGHLDGGGADARGSAVDEQGLAGLEATALEDVGPDGEEGLGQRGGLGQVEAARDGEALHGGGDAVLGVAAARHEGGDRVADFPGRRGGGRASPEPRPLPAPRRSATAATTPATSRPGMSEAPGGGG